MVLKIMCFFLYIKRDMVKKYSQIKDYFQLWFVLSISYFFSSRAASLFLSSEIQFLKSYKPEASGSRQHQNREDQRVWWDKKIIALKQL